MEAFTLDSTEIIVLATAGGLFLIQIIYYLCLYNRIHARSRAVKQGDTHFTQELPPISVIICAREESENLRRNLGAVLEQDYPLFEVIVINDGNTDESEDYLTILEEKYPHLYHSFVPDSSRYISRKKLAVTLGIKASKYEWLVFTNANCMPQSNQWLRLMARNFTSRTQVVLGYSGYERGKGWLHGTQSQLEFLPERHTDVIFAVLAEELGLVGILILLALYILLIMRGLWIAARAQTTFGRVMAGGLMLILFVYVFVNIGMVSGILPVVGVPLPLVSYGGSALIVLMAGFGIVMSIHTHRKMLSKSV